jgi:DNA-binding HxlR family transcriptional regulator
VYSVNDALAIVGDRYALLVARELRCGQTRFQDIAVGTGAPATSSPHGCASSSRPA